MPALTREVLYVTQVMGTQMCGIASSLRIGFLAALSFIINTPAGSRNFGATIGFHYQANTAKPNSIICILFFPVNSLYNLNIGLRQLPSSNVF